MQRRSGQGGGSILRRILVAIPIILVSMTVLTMGAGAVVAVAGYNYYAQGLEDPKVTAKVRRVRGRTYEVRYAITKADGDTVAFSERSDTANSVLKTVRGRRGAFRFQATDGRAGTRSIVARVDHEGIPRRELVVASYPLVPLTFDRICPGFRAELLGLDDGALHIHE